VSPNRPNRLSDTIEPRYRLTLFLFLTFVPVVIATIAVGATFAKSGVWIGSEDEIGRALLISTAVCSVIARWWRPAREALNFFVIAAFGGRAFGFLIVGGPGLSLVNRTGAAMIWAAITFGSLLLILQMDTLLQFRKERRELGLER
jgi:hypothetical protein